MFSSLKIGRYFGIPVYLHATLLLLPALVLFNTAGHGWASTLFLLVATPALFLCVLLHEFGHALMARWFGIQTRDVTLYPIGGVARLERMTERPAEEILIALAGPAVNVVIAFLLTPVLGGLFFLGGHVTADPINVTFNDPPLIWLTRFCGYVWILNVGLVVFNLIPAFPMDGGRVLRAVLAACFGFLRGTEIAVPIGIAVIVMFGIGMAMLGAFSPMLLIIVPFIALMGPMELRALRYRERQRNEAREWEPQASPPPDMPYTPLPYPDEEAQPPPSSSGFTGYTWDREFGVWVKWQDGQRIAAHWHGPE